MQPRAVAADTVQLLTHSPTWAHGPPLAQPTGSMGDISNGTLEKVSFPPSPPQLERDAGGAELGQGGESRLRLNPTCPPNAPVLCPLSQQPLTPSPSHTTGCWAASAAPPAQAQRLSHLSQASLPCSGPRPCQSRAAEGTRSPAAAGREHSPHGLGTPRPQAGPTGNAAARWRTGACNTPRPRQRALRGLDVPVPGSLLNSLGGRSPSVPGTVLGSEAGELPARQARGWK